jgi:hypothetical protein
VTGPSEPSKPRTRSGLAKLRGAPEEAPPSAAVRESESAPPETPSAPVNSTPGAVVTLEKADPEPALDAAPLEGTAAPGGKGPGALVLATVAILVVAIAVLVFFVSTNPFDSSSKSSSDTAAAGNGGTPDQRLAVVRSARQFTVSFFTYDYRNIDAYFKRIEAASAGAFRTDFVSKEKTLKTVVSELKTVATGQVPDTGAGLFQLNGDKATALIAANFNASNAVTKNGQKRYRVKIALQRIKGVWLVTNFDQVV